MDLWHLYRHMLRSRLFEETVISLWGDGLISGEMHLGAGEEAIVAGTVLQLRAGDAMALDHRGTPPMLMRGVDPLLLLRELLGHPDGLNGGMGGHMHLFAPEFLAASSGIVGSSGPAAVGFALAARYLRPGNLALSFFGEGAMNEGMMMEAMNLAIVQKLPVLFICKDSKLAIATKSSSVSGGELLQRARGFGLPSVSLDGTDVEAVWPAATEAMERARSGRGPTFIVARCRHLYGHMTSQPLFRLARDPVGEIGPLIRPLLSSALQPKGASPAERIRSLRGLVSLIREAMQGMASQDGDPLKVTRRRLKSEPERLAALEDEVLLEVHQILEEALEPVG